MVGPLLENADLLLAGADELELITGQPADRLEETVAGLLDAGVGTVLIKAADKAASAFTPRPGTGTNPLVRPGRGPGRCRGRVRRRVSLRLAAGPNAGRLPGEAAAVAAMVVQCAGDVEGLATPAERDRILAAVRNADVDLVAR